MTPAPQSDSRPAAILPGDAHWAPLELAVTWHRAPIRAHALVVLLPGAYMTPAQFAEAGFPSTLASTAPAVDLALPALTLDQLAGGAALPALRHQLIRPAHEHGYQQVWLGGISLGGLLALSYARQYPEEVSGLCLLAPYPGSRLTVSAVLGAGGPGCWEPTPAQAQDEEFRIWHWLGQPPALPVFLGYGAEDRFATAMALLGSRLPAGAVHRVPGDHNWAPWRALWRRFLGLGWLRPPAAKA